MTELQWKIHEHLPIIFQFCKLIVKCEKLIFLGITHQIEKTGR